MYDVWELLVAGLLEVVLYPIVAISYLLLLFLEAASSVLTCYGGGCCCVRRSLPAPPANILITGAGSGIGRAMAVYYAKRSARHIALFDVNADNLRQTAEECREAGVPGGAVLTTSVHVVDVTDGEAMRKAIETVDADTPLDLVCANAGLAESTIKDMFDLDEAGRRIGNVNVMGVVNTVLPAVACMRVRGHGQIAMTSSMSAFLPYWPQAPTYAATKAFVKSYGMGLRAHLWSTGIRVSVLAPGFIDTPMVQAVAESRAKKGLKAPAIPKMATDAAVEYMCRGLAQDKAVVTMPLYSIVLIRLLLAMPHVCVDWITRNFPAHAFLGHVAKSKYVGTSPVPKHLKALAATAAAAAGEGGASGAAKKE